METKRIPNPNGRKGCLEHQNRIKKIYCSKIQLYADNQYHIKNNLHSIAILTAFSTCKSIKKY